MSSYLIGIIGVFMLYSDAQKNQIKKDLKQMLTNHDVLNQTINDVLNEVVQYVKPQQAPQQGTNVAGGIYHERKDKITTQYTALNKQFQQNQKILYDISRDQNNSLTQLETETDEIIKEFMDTDVKPAFDLLNVYDEVLNSKPLPPNAQGLVGQITDVDAYIDMFSDDVAANPLVKEIKTGLYEEPLAKHYITSADGVLHLTGRINDNAAEKGKSVKSYIFEAPQTIRNGFYESLNKIIKNSKELAKKTLNEKIDEKEKAKKTTDELYATNIKELKTVFSAEDTRLIDDFNYIVTEYGSAKLSGDTARVGEIKNDESYKKILNAIVKKEVHESEIDYDGQKFRLDGLYRSVLIAVGTGAPKSRANKIIGEIKSRKKTIERRVENELDEVFTSIYKNVLAGSDLDNTSLGRKKKNLILNGNRDKSEKTWDENSGGIHAEAGLGWYYSQFVEEVDFKVKESPGYTDQIKHAGANLKYAGKKAVHGLKSLWGSITGNAPASFTENAPAPLEDRIVTCKGPRKSVDKLRNKIVTKHKHAAYHGLSEKNKIEIDDVIDLGLGLAAEENGFGEIDSKWDAVTNLDHDSSIEEIMNVYSDASDLGELINQDAKRHTSIVDKQFKWLDNYVNEKSGITYKIKDDTIDFVNGIFKLAKIEDKGVPKSSAEDKWSIHDTAIRPNKYPLVYELIAAAGLLVGGYALAYDTTQRKPLTTEGGEASDVLSFWEVLKEIVLIKLLSKH